METKITKTNRIIFFLVGIFMFLVLVSVISSSVSAATDLDFRLSALLDGVYTQFYAETDSGSLVGYDGNDAVLPGNPDDLPAALYSVVGGNNLQIDSWSKTTLTRTINLVYYIPSKKTGVLTLRWNNYTGNFTVDIKDYNDDATYSFAARTIDTKSQLSYNLNQNNVNGYRYLQLIVNYYPPSTTGSGGPGGGGGGALEPLQSILIDVPKPLALESTGPIEFNITVTNNGDVAFQNVFLNGSILMNSKQLKTPVVLSKTIIPNLVKGQKETILVKTRIDSSEVTVYEIVVNATAQTPYYKTQGRFYVTFMGKNAAGIVKVIAFTEGLIEENAQCYELKDMILDAKKLLAAGDTKNALETAQKALDSCKRIIEGPTKPVIAQIQENQTLFYLTIGIIIAIIIGIGFNLYRMWKFRGFHQYKTRRFGF